MGNIQPVILAGGTGSRLWPLSRELYPKQLLQLTNHASLLQNTLQRVSMLPDVLPPLVVVGEAHRFITLAQLEELGVFKEFSILLEPTGKNTAPAICGAANFCANSSDDVTLLVLPADHVIGNIANFVSVVTQAEELAANGSLVTFGIEPMGPETGYGYIEKGAGVDVVSFKEKPHKELAEKYLEKGNFYWNSGMFAFSRDSFLAEMEIYGSKITQQMAEAVRLGGTDGKFFRFDRAAMEKCPSDSIDYVLMEKTDKAAVVVADLAWSDIGSWQALWDVEKKDENGNVLKGDVFAEDTRNCLVQSEKNLVAVVGIDDIMVVETADAVLVAPLSRSQEVKKVVTHLKNENRKEFSVHATVYRPWGSYTVLEEQPRYQIKRITVNPGGKLSLQMHHHRHEHWVVVSGTAKVVNGEDEILLYENQSTYIPSGTMHRLENPGVIPLELIEVQNGSYLGEDDIVRFEDVYGRENEK